MLGNGVHRRSVRHFDSNTESSAIASDLPGCGSLPSVTVGNHHSSAVTAAASKRPLERPSAHSSSRTLLGFDGFSVFCEQCAHDGFFRLSGVLTISRSVSGFLTVPSRVRGVLAFDGRTTRVPSSVLFLCRGVPGSVRGVLLLSGSVFPLSLLRFHVHLSLSLFSLTSSFPSASPGILHSRKSPTSHPPTPFSPFHPLLPSTNSPTPLSLLPPSPIFSSPSLPLFRPFPSTCHPTTPVSLLFPLPSTCHSATDLLFLRGMCKYIFL